MCCQRRVHILILEAYRSWHETGLPYHVAFLACYVEENFRGRPRACRCDHLHERDDVLYDEQYDVQYDVRDDDCDDERDHERGDESHHEV